MDSQDRRVLEVCWGLRDRMVNQAKGAVVGWMEAEVSLERLVGRETEALMVYQVCPETMVTGEIQGRKGQSDPQEPLEKKVLMVSQGREVNQENLVWRG